MLKIICGLPRKKSLAPSCPSSSLKTRRKRWPSPTTRVLALVPLSGPPIWGAHFACWNRIQAGTVWINTYRTGSFMVPFGGFKDSGIGRENGVDAIREFLQVKSVWINIDAATANPFMVR